MEVAVLHQTMNLRHTLLIHIMLTMMMTANLLLIRIHRIHVLPLTLRMTMIMVLTVHWFLIIQTIPAIHIK